MLEFTNVFYFLFLDPRKSLTDVEAFFEKQHKSPVITDAISLYDALERSGSSARNREEQPQGSLQLDNDWSTDSSTQVERQSRRTHGTSGGLAVA